MKYNVKEVFAPLYNGYKSPKKVPAAIQKQRVQILAQIGSARLVSVLLSNVNKETESTEFKVIELFDRLQRYLPFELLLMKGILITDLIYLAKRGDIEFFEHEDDPVITLRKSDGQLMAKFNRVRIRKIFLRFSDEFQEPDQPTREELENEIRSEQGKEKVAREKVVVALFRLYLGRDEYFGAKEFMDRSGQFSFQVYLRDCLGYAATTARDYAKTLNLLEALDQQPDDIRNLDLQKVRAILPLKTRPKQVEALNLSKALSRPELQKRIRTMRKQEQANLDDGLDHLRKPLLKDSEGPTDSEEPDEDQDPETDSDSDVQVEDRISDETVQIPRKKVEEIMKILQFAFDGKSAS